MKTIKKPNNDRRFAGRSLLRLAMEIASHPAFASYTPTDAAGALAIGQSGRTRRLGGRAPIARRPGTQPNYTTFAAPAGELGCP